MAVVLVTGVSGSGKSTVSRRLTAMGYHAISMDADDLLCGWYDTVSGQRVPRPTEPDAAWLTSHEWRWDPDRLDAIIADARTRGVAVLFLCGLAANAVRLADRFDVCLLLEIDRTTMTQRLNDPTRGNVYGRTAASQAHAFAAYDPYVTGWRRSGAITIDATQHVDSVTQDILLTAASALELRPPRTPS